MRAFLALLLLSGYVSLPRRRMYWKKLPDVNNEAVASTMSRHRFEEILRFLYLADNNHLQKEDKYAKIRPLVSLLNAKWLAHFPKENFLAVDQAMFPYYGRNGLKQHIHGKPITFGYEVWCLCTRTGYLVQAIPYQESTTGYSNLLSLVWVGLLFWTSYPSCRLKSSTDCFSTTFLLPFHQLTT